MTTSVVSFNNNELLDDVKNAMLDTNFRSYPVVEGGRYIGMIDKVRLLKPDKPSLFLLTITNAHRPLKAAKKLKSLR